MPRLTRSATPTLQSALVYRAPRVRSRPHAARPRHRTTAPRRAVRSRLSWLSTVRLSYETRRRRAVLIAITVSCAAEAFGAGLVLGAHAG